MLCVRLEWNYRRISLCMEGQSMADSKDTLKTRNNLI